MSYVYFQHSGDLWRDFPRLVPGVLYVQGITAAAESGPAADRFAAIAKSRLAAVPAEGEWPEIQAWRRAFAAMGLKPTQYRCAAESLLRRFRKEGGLCHDPRLHPLVDLCNAVSLAYAIPVAVFDASAFSGRLEVRYATGEEEYLTFAGDIEHPAPGEVIFADQAGQAHARRWTNRQSGRSAVRDTTTEALIVAEALHDQAPHDVADLTATLAAELQSLWSVPPVTQILTAASPRFSLPNRPAQACLRLSLVRAVAQAAASRPVRTLISAFDSPGATGPQDLETEDTAEWALPCCCRPALPVRARRWRAKSARRRRRPPCRVGQRPGKRGLTVARRSLVAR